jgi:hypothetical protein
MPETMKSGAHTQCQTCGVGISINTDGLANAAEIQKGYRESASGNDDQILSLTRNQTAAALALSIGRQL